MDRNKLVIFGWAGVIEQKDTDRAWKMADRVCRVKGTSLKELYHKSPENSTITDKRAFLKKLQEMTEGVSMSYPHGPDWTDLIGDEQEYGRGRYIFDIYQSSSALISYRKDIAVLLQKLPGRGIRTALLCDCGLWDLRRQNMRIDLSACTFVWRSCQLGISTSGGDLFAEAARTSGCMGFAPKDVLYISSSLPELEQADDICGWGTFYDKEFLPAETLEDAIMTFAGSHGIRQEKDNAR